MISLIFSKIEELLNEALNHKKPWSIRYNSKWKYGRPDDNIFALASTAFIIQTLRLPEPYKTKVSVFHEQIVGFYANYRNKDENPTYNFYRTKPSGHFPFGRVMHRFDHFRLPDDIDDTALIYLTNPNLDPNLLQAYVKKFACFTPSYTLAGKSVKRKIYNTWTGKNMPPEHDACVLLNWMYFVLQSKLPLEKLENDTLLFLADQIDRLAQNPFWISRHYGHVAFLVYHYARLMHGFDLLPLLEKKETLIGTALAHLKTEKVFLNKVLIEIALLKWGVKRPKLAVPSNWAEGFYSFIGAPLAPFPMLKSLATYPIFHIFWKTEIHEWALLLEYEVLYKESQPLAQ
jgi:hypothetical protein